MDNKYWQVGPKNQLQVELWSSKTVGWKNPIYTTPIDFRPFIGVISPYSPMYNDRLEAHLVGSH